MSRGITKENLLFILPPALAYDPSILALAEAAAEALEARLAEIDKARVISNIDALDEEVLDILARDFKVDWWDTEYSIDEKRRTLKGSWRVHKILGTKAAVETAISAIYPNTTVLEWFEYGGKPYHFQLRINISDDDIDSERMLRVLDRMRYYKNLRSHNDGIHYFMEPPEPMTVFAWTGCHGLNETMETEVKVPELTPPGGRAETDVAAGVVGEKAQMRTELDMSAEASRGTAEIRAGAGAIGANAIMVAALDFRTNIPAPTGIHQKYVTEETANDTLE